MKREPRADRFNLRRFMVLALRLCTGSVKPKKPPAGPFRTVVILAQEKLGDAILFTPLPRLIKRAWPSTVIHVVTFGKNRKFYEADPHVDRVFAIKSDFLAAFREIGRCHYDILINTKDHPSFSFLLLTRIIRADFRLGIFHPYHKGFFDHLIAMDFHCHVVEKNCAFLTALNLPFDASQCRPQLPPVPASKAIVVAAEKIHALPRPRIGINLSAGENDREWPVERWRELLTEFPHARFAIFSMPDKKIVRTALESQFPSCIPLPDTATLYDVAEILKHLDLLVTPDTSLIHVCSCLNIPVVALFRSQRNHLSHFSPYMIPHRLVVSPTMLVHDIPVESTVAAVKELLSQSISAKELPHGR